MPEHGLGVPVEFWLHGSAAVLTGPEILTYLMFRYLARRWPGVQANCGVGIAPTPRRLEYGVSSETYACASELEEFGLLRRTTVRRSSVPEEEETTARPREVQRFQVVDVALKESAFETVSKVLTNEPTPARVAQFDSY